MKVNLFLVGAAKSGTTTLYNILDSHPEVYACPIKEPNYFGTDITWEEFRDDYQKETYLDFEKYLSQEHLDPVHNCFVESGEVYHALFREAEEESYLLDASTSYLYSEKAAKEIKEYNPEAKIIIILRDPVERTISHYKMDYASGSQPSSDMVEGIKKDYHRDRKGYGISNIYVELSLYYDQIKCYLNNFDQEDILFLRFEELKEEEDKVKADIFSFLNLDPSSSLGGGEVHNKTQMPRFAFLNKVRGIKNLLPATLINYLKPILFKEDIPIEVGEREQRYIASLVEEDWKKTQELLQ